jgi:hypothetical protein
MGWATFRATFLRTQMVTLADSKRVKAAGFAFLKKSPKNVTRPVLC